MPELCHASPEDQIEAIDAAVRDGGRIVSVEVFGSGDAVVRVLTVERKAGSPLNPLGGLATYDSVTQSFSCGIVAAEHARELMFHPPHFEEQVAYIRDPEHPERLPIVYPA